MAEKSIPDQIIDDFMGKIEKQGILDPEKLQALKEILNNDKPKKAEILQAIRGDD